MLSGCAAVATDGEIASTENPETSFATCSYLRTQQASCDDLTKAYNEGFRAGKEIIAAEFRTRTELNQPYVWKPPMISEVDMPARVVNGVMIPAHQRTRDCETRILGEDGKSCRKQINTRYAAKTKLRLWQFAILPRPFYNHRDSTAF